MRSEYLLELSFPVDSMNHRKWDGGASCARLILTFVMDHSSGARKSAGHAPRKTGTFSICQDAKKFWYSDVRGSFFPDLFVYLPTELFRTTVPRPKVSHFLFSILMRP
jgi:hypothetical protein